MILENFIPANYINVGFHTSTCLYTYMKKENRYNKIEKGYKK